MDIREPSKQDPEPPKIPRNPFKSLSFRDWVYLPHILSRQDRALLGFFVALALIGGITGGAMLLYDLTEPAPALGGTYREGLVRPPERINPLFLSNNDTDRDLTSLVFAKLLSYDASGKLEPDLAESYVISDDGKTYTLELKKGVSWHDRVELNADDVMFTVRAIQDPSYKSSLRPNWQGVIAERLGDFSVRFTLKQPYSPFLQNLALPIIPRHIWENVPPEAASISEANIKPIGSGPYMFENLEQDRNGIITKYQLSTNTNYHGEGPFIKNIEFTFYQNEDALVQAYRSGLIDGISNLSPKNVDLLKNLGAQVAAARMPRVFAVFLNEANPILRDKNIRYALSMSIPKEDLIAKALGGGAIPIETPIPPGTFGYNAEIEKTPFDIEKAKSILDKAGWKDADGDGIREKKSAKRGEKPTPLKITLTTSDWRDLSATAEALKGYWREIGVDAEVRALPIGELESTVIRPRQYDALIFGEILGRDPDPFSFWHSSQLRDPGLNIALYHSPRVDTLLEQARRTTDPAVIEDKYKEFQKIVDNDFPTIFLYSPTYFYAYRPDFKRADLQTLMLPSERFETAEQWFINTKRVF